MTTAFRHFNALDLIRFAPTSSRIAHSDVINSLTPRYHISHREDGHVLRFCCSRISRADKIWCVLTGLGKAALYVSGTKLLLPMKP